MNVIEHAGVTLAVVFMAEKALQLAQRRQAVPAGVIGGTDSGAPPQRERVRLWQVDYRAVVLGAVLPDIIDKPLVWLATDLVNNSLRSFGHTLTFAALLLFCSLVTAGTSRRFFLWLAVGVLAHIVQDQMWTMPDILLWPFLGWSFPHGSTTVAEWWSFQWRRFDLGIPEVTTAALFAAIALNVLLRRRVLRFLRTGAL